ncbi:DUF4936 family protein [Thiohalorhabdus sp.]|uniref:DUF4936 family protein n=1 Tax=Thiohalorhabdus sp. TaxID=3094134 RepID=UPI002FC2AD62
MSQPDWGIFVYYRMDPEKVGNARWSALFADVERRTGVAGRLYGPAPDGRTWMEVYEPVPGANRSGFEKHLSAAVAEVGMEAVLAPGEYRHVEAFPRSKV